MIDYFYIEKIIKVYMSVNLIDELVNREKLIFSSGTYINEVNKWKKLKSDGKISSFLFVLLIIISVSRSSE